MKKNGILIIQNRLVYICILCLLALVSNWRVLNFTFWIDDWIYLWRALYDQRELLTNWLHFGTALEFYVFGFAFGINPFCWQLFGIILRVFLAFVSSNFIRKLTGSLTAGIYSGILIAASSIGVQSVGWISAHIVLIEGILLVLGITSFLSYTTSRNRFDLVITLEYLALAILFDFIRALPICFVFLVMLLTNNSSHQVFNLRKVIPMIVIALFIVTILFTFLLFPAVASSPMTQAVGRVIDNPYLFLKLFLYIGNFFGTVWNIFFGWIHPIFIDSASGLIHILSVIFVTIFFIACIMLRKQLLEKNSSLTLKILSTLFVWIFSFLAIHAIFEPRYSYDPFHRYMLIPSIGSIGILSYAISRLSTLTQRILLVSILGVFIFGSNSMLSKDMVFREKTKVDAIWSEIDLAIQKNTRPKIFYYFGEDPSKKYILDLSGTIPFELRRNTQDTSHWAYAINSVDTIASIVCGNNPSYKQVQINDVYGWFIYNSGNIVSISEDVRNSVSEIMKTRGCDY